MKNLAYVLAMIVAANCAGVTVAEDVYEPKTLEMVDERLDIQEKKIQNNTNRVDEIERKLDRLIQLMEDRGVTDPVLASTFVPKVPATPATLVGDKAVVPAPVVPVPDAAPNAAPSAITYKWVKTGCINGVCYYKKVAVNAAGEQVQQLQPQPVLGRCGGCRHRRAASGRWYLGKGLARLFRR